MNEEIKNLKSKLKKAQSEEDVLSALDSFSRQLTDEELEYVVGGSQESLPENDSGNTTPENAL